ncbi:MAG: hypothetical protein J2P20_10730 [Pseudonocardia sp.]|nr:hypothetical protein [Pseudonocardia sp.]MBO0876461.1 hypothetical protein [Pseudonocardia sp.]
MFSRIAVPMLATALAAAVVVAYRRGVLARLGRRTTVRSVQPLRADRR